MKLNIKIITVFILAFVLFIPFINASSEATWQSYDTEDDVMYFDDGIYQSTGDFQNDIDIVGVELVESNLIINLQDIPQDDFDHYYVLYVHWFDWPYKPAFVNYTNVEFSHGKNHVATQLYFDSIPMSADIYDGITIEGNSIQCPIPIFSSIENTTADNYYCAATYYINESEGDVYFDNISSTVTLQTGLFPGLAFNVTIVSLVTIAIVFLIRKKK